MLQKLILLPDLSLVLYLLSLFIPPLFFYYVLGLGGPDAKLPVDLFLPCPDTRPVLCNFFIFSIAFVSFSALSSWSCLPRTTNSDHSESLIPWWITIGSSCGQLPGGFFFLDFEPWSVGTGWILEDEFWRLSPGLVHQLAVTLDRIVGIATPHAVHDRATDL